MITYQKGQYALNNDIREKDWKLVRDLQGDVLNTACDRIMQKVEALAKSRGSENHKSYNKLWKLMKQEDEQISLMFHDFKRSNAVFKLAMWKKNDLLSDKVFDSLTEETRERIRVLNHMSTR